jgi:hypothetical protein
MLKLIKIILIVLAVLITIEEQNLFAKYTPDYKVIKLRTVYYLNQLRVLNNLNPLVRDITAEKVAQKRANYQKANTLTHDGLSEALKEITNSNYGTENLAYQWIDTFDSDDEVAKSIIELWFEDKGIPNKGHLKQMLNPYYDIVGIGLKVDKEGKIYISMVYASTTTMPLTKEIADQINDFYKYFNSNSSIDYKPLQ